MNNNDKNSTRSISELCLTASVILLPLHIYFYYFPVFTRQGWTTPVTNRLLEQIVKTGLFDNAYYSKGLALFFLLLSVLASPVRRTPSISRKRNAWLLLAGLGIYLIFISGVSDWSDVSQPGLVGYSISVFTSWLMILTASTRLLRQIRLPWSKDDPFGRGQAGFPQEQAKVSSDHSLHLQGWFVWQKKKQKTWINLVNPRRGVLVMGSPGSGKSWFIIEPFIRQLIEKGVAMFIYDFKHDALTKVAWAHFQANRDKYPVNTPFYSINFTDLSRSHRCNILDPSTLTYLSDALDASRTILLSINKT
ncbi:MAG: YWFCY domain-containing protein, partial [Bacteroidetes bacterium]|nr:YWFCY domain-containing protein [Bacteroidota bacterium]